MQITKDTKVIDILDAYGDIAGVMETFGVKRVGPYNIRRLLTRFISVGLAARIHGVPQDEFLDKLRRATASATHA